MSVLFIVTATNDYRSIIKSGVKNVNGCEVGKHCVFCVCSHNVKMSVKLKADYGAVLHMPVLKEGKDRVSQLPGSMESYAQPGDQHIPLHMITAAQSPVFRITLFVKVISLLCS